MAAKDIFERLKQNSHLRVYVSYYEIYQSQLYDLLNNRNKLTPRDDGKGNIVIANLKQFPALSYDEMMQVLCFGNQERTTGKTSANETSSRSHAILNLSLFENKQVFGKLNFIDLAGSERASDRGYNSKKTRMMEGAEINKSLLALKECIRALTQDNKFPPFRTSKLTLVLRDSFIGNSRTCMIATVSPNLSNSEHTLNTLRYADRYNTHFRYHCNHRLMYSSIFRLKELKEEMMVDFICHDSNNIATFIPPGDTSKEIATDVGMDLTISAIPMTDTPVMNINDQRKDTIEEKPIGEKEVVEEEVGDEEVIEEQVIEEKSTEVENKDMEEKNETKNRITRSYIRNFSHLHNKQIVTFENFLDKSKRLEKDISSLFNSTDLNSFPKIYTQYQHSLNELLDVKKSCIKKLQDKVEEEFEDE
jgi:hypothetical protein